MISLNLTQNTIADDIEKLINKIANPGNRQVRSVADAVRQGFQDNFSTEGAASGVPWAQLAPFTVLQRQELGFSGAHPILVRSGGYRATWVQRGAADNYELIQRTSSGLIIEAGSDDERADELSLGTFRMPARPVAELGPQSEQRVSNTIELMINQIERDIMGAR